MEISTLVKSNEDLIFSSSLSASRTEEKAALGLLNHRFGNFIERTKTIVNYNEELQARIDQLENPEHFLGGGYKLYAEEIHKLQEKLIQASIAKTRSTLSLNRCYKELDSVHKRFITEVEDRNQAEFRAKSLKKDIDNATLKKVELERKVEMFRQEIILHKGVFNENYELLSQKLQSLQNKEITLNTTTPNVLSKSLLDIRKEYEHMTKNGKVNVQSRYKDKEKYLTNKLERQKKINLNMKTQAASLEKEMQTSSLEIKTLTSSKSVFENQIKEAEDRYRKEIEEYRQKQVDLEERLADLKTKKLRQTEAYAKLFSDKVSLEEELQKYRNLLEMDERLTEEYEKLKALTLDEFDDQEDKDYSMKPQYYSISHLDGFSHSTQPTSLENVPETDDVSENEVELKHKTSGPFYKSAIDHINGNLKTNYRSEMWSVETGSSSSDDTPTQEDVF